MPAGWMSNSYTYPVPARGLLPAMPDTSSDTHTNGPEHARRSDENDSAFADALLRDAHTTGPSGRDCAGLRSSYVSAGG